MPKKIQKGKVTIVTICLNLIKYQRVKLFEEMFKSVHSQTYKNIEHLIIDGASTDGTVEFIEKLARKHKKHELRIISEPDTGIYDAMNKGFKNASGDYIIVMNTDDKYLEKDAIKWLVEALEENDNDFAVADSWFHDEILFKANVENFVWTHPFIHNTFLAKRSLYEEYGYFDTSLKIGADYELIYRLLKNNLTYAYVDKTITTLLDGGYSTQFDDVAFNDYLTALKRHLGCFVTKKDLINICCKKLTNKFIFKFFVFVKNKYLRKIFFSNEAFAYFGRDYGRYKYYIKLRFISKPVEKLVKKSKSVDWKYYLRLRFVIKPIEKLVKKLRTKDLKYYLQLRFMVKPIENFVKKNKKKKM